MSITSPPTTPGSLWASQPTPTPTWAPPGAPQSWASAPAITPGWQPPMSAAAPRRCWLPIGIAVSAVVLATAAGTAVTVAHHHPHHAAGAHPVSAAGPSMSVPPAPPLVRDESLPALLLDPGSVNAIMASTDLVVNPKLSTARLYRDTTDKPDCGGVWANANRAAYTGSGWQAVQTQYLTEARHPAHEVYQSVISFPSADTAKSFVATEGQRWSACRTTAITTTNPDIAPQTWLITGVGQDDGVLSSESTREGSRGYTCQHALTARANVVIDAEACGWDIAHQGSTIAHRIAEQIARSL